MCVCVGVCVKELQAGKDKGRRDSASGVGLALVHVRGHVISAISLVERKSLLSKRALTWPKYSGCLPTPKLFGPISMHSN